jgi:hypothetical protein
MTLEEGLREGMYVKILPQVSTHHNFGDAISYSGTYRVTKKDLYELSEYCGSNRNVIEIRNIPGISNASRF